MERFTTIQTTLWSVHLSAARMTRVMCTSRKSLCLAMIVNYVQPSGLTFISMSEDRVGNAEHVLCIFAQEEQTIAI